MDDAAAELLHDEPAWPRHDGPHLFLLEASGPLEERLLLDWIERRRPDGVAATTVQVALLPQTRRRRRRRNDPRLDAILAEGDPLLIPLRVSWLPARQHAGHRKAGLRDLLTLGDPRDPDPLRQYLIHRTRPDRARVLMAEPATASQLRERWKSAEERDRGDGSGFVDWVSLQAWLALERAERGLRGNRYKVPKFPLEMLLERPGFSRGVAELARKAGVSDEQMWARTRRYAREIAATHSPFVIDLVTGAFGWLISKAYVDLRYSPLDLEEAYAVGSRHPLVFLPSHKSNFDHLVLQYVLYEHGLPPNHTAGGINMNFFPVGPILRRSGVFFIRREFRDNEPYKFVLRRYLDYLLEKRFPLEWYIEGGRSRSGKLREPRLGMLSYVVESYRRGSTEDVIFVPVSIAYDQIHDVSSYAEEQRGGDKDSESLSWLMRTIRGLRRRYGAVHLRFGRRISLADYLAAHPDLEREVGGRSPLVPKLAFEIAVGINQATPITPISLVTLALLTTEDRAITLDETVEILAPFVDFVSRRSLPVTEKLEFDDAAHVAAALDALTSHGVVTRFDGTTATVYRVKPDQHLAAAYYRNTIIHHFVNASITELALVRARTNSSGNLAGDVISAAVEVRDLLKFEFFFSPRQEFASEIERELADHDPLWREHLAEGDVDAILNTFRPFLSPAVLRPFLEAYRVVGDLLEHHPQPAPEPKKLAGEALDLARQYDLQQRIRSSESVSTVLLANAIQLAANQHLLVDDPALTSRRRSFAATLRGVVDDLVTIEALDVARRAGLA